MIIHYIVIKSLVNVDYVQHVANEQQNYDKKHHTSLHSSIAIEHIEVKIAQHSSAVASFVKVIYNVKLNEQVVERIEISVVLEINSF